MQYYILYLFFLRPKWNRVIRLEYNIMHLLTQYQAEKKVVALVTVTSSEGTHQDLVGSMALIDHGGNILAGDLSNSPVQKEAALEGKICIQRGLSRKSVITVENDRIEIFTKSFINRDHLIIAGAGTVALHVFRFAKMLGYHITVIDNRAEMLTPQRFPEAEELLLGDIAAQLKSCSIAENTNIVIATHHHEFDEQALQAVISSPAMYIGVLGNPRRIEKYLQNLDPATLPSHFRDKIHAPIGLDLGGKQTVEIALAVVAELQAVKYGRTGGFMNQTPRPPLP